MQKRTFTTIHLDDSLDTYMVEVSAVVDVRVVDGVPEPTWRPMTVRAERAWYGGEQVDLRNVTDTLSERLDREERKRWDVLGGSVREALEMAAADLHYRDDRCDACPHERSHHDGSGICWSCVGTARGCVHEVMQ